MRGNFLNDCSEHTKCRACGSQVSSPQFLWRRGQNSLCTICLSRFIEEYIPGLSWDKITLKNIIANNTKKVSLLNLSVVSNTKFFRCSFCHTERSDDYIVGSIKAGENLCRLCLNDSVVELQNITNFKEKNNQESVSHLIGWELFDRVEGELFERKSNELLFKTKKKLIKQGAFYLLADALVLLGKNYTKSPVEIQGERKYFKLGVYFGLLTNNYRAIVYGCYWAARSEALYQIFDESPVNYKKNNAIICLKTGLSASLESNNLKLKVYAQLNVLEIFDLAFSFSSTELCRSLLEMTNDSWIDASSRIELRRKLSEADLRVLEGDIYSALNIYSGLLKGKFDYKEEIPAGAWETWEKTAEKIFQSLQQYNVVHKWLDGIHERLSQISKLNIKGIAFEKIVAELFDLSGFDIKRSKKIAASNLDFECDLIVRKKNESILFSECEFVVECKFWQKPIDRDTIVKLVFLKSGSHYSNFMVVHLGKVSEGALKLAKRHGISLLSIWELIEFLEKSTQNQAADVIQKCQHKISLLKKMLDFGEIKFSRKIDHNYYPYLSDKIENPIGREAFIAINPNKKSEYQIYNLIEKVLADNPDITDKTFLILAVHVCLWLDSCSTKDFGKKLLESKKVPRHPIR